MRSCISSTSVVPDLIEETGNVDAEYEQFRARDNSNFEVLRVRLFPQIKQVADKIKQNNTKVLPI